LTFLKVSFGGLALGLLFGVAGRWLIRWLGRAVIVSLLAAYASYLVAETWLHVSGVMATLACGLWIGHALHSDSGAAVKSLVSGWEQLGWVANSALFLLAGVTITVSMFEERWLAMLLGIGAVLVTRLLVVWLAAGLNALTPGQQSISVAYRSILFAGGLRGAVTLALALSLPLELEGWWTVQSIAYGVVVFSLLVQAPLLQPLVKQLQRHGHLQVGVTER
jgi:CPA1 family monovalent cation:H+ antiporter